LIVTTSERPDEESVRKAIRFAEELGARYVTRRNETLSGLDRTVSQGDGVLVVGAGSLKLAKEAEHPLFFHPSMSLVRAKRLLAGGNDVMIDVSGASRGDLVLDCTAGLASDSIVFSLVVGESGLVTALEASSLLHLIVREGLQEHETGIPLVDEAMRRINAVRANHVDYLREISDRSVDIVYFDPMFDKPMTASASLLPLRSHAIRDSLEPETIREAVRVARKAVVLKDDRASEHFRRLGFTQPKRTGTAAAYGVIRID
jgi:16S rRNA (guanine1516-N2)-methyltransferase